MHLCGSKQAGIPRKMAKLFKWLLSYPSAIPAVALVIILSTVSFQLLPDDRTWSDNFNSLLMHVAGTNVKNHSTSNLPNLASAETLSSPPSSQSFLSPAVTPSAQNAPRKEGLARSDVSEGSSWPPASSPDGGNHPVLEGENFTTRSISSAVPSEAPVASPAVLVSEVSNRSVEEKFLVPLLSFQVGAGNQFMEYLSAAVMARALNRTLCLSLFFPGPSRHTGRLTSGLAWEDRYEVASLSRFTRVASLQRCLRQCHDTLDDKWILKPSRVPQMDDKWRKYPGNDEALNLNWDYVRWTAPEDIVTSLGSRSARCVGVLGLFPGLRWRGAFLAVSAFIRPAAHILKLADALQKNALGVRTRYLAVHWRFEESECRGHHVGLCFVRCDDGSVIDSGLRPNASEWHKAEKQCPKKGSFRGVTLDKNDIILTIHERALKHNVKAIYLATDGWLRGEASVALVKEIVESLRKRGLIVVGLWKVPGLPNFSRGQYFDPMKSLGKNLHIRNLDGAQVALVEQELCSRSVSFMGSGPSTFSLSVFRVRLARRRVQQIESREHVNTSVVAMDELVAETLLRDAHPAGLHCRYLRYMKRARVNETVETAVDEYPDGWLDLEACEGRMGRGGRCRVAECF